MKQREYVYVGEPIPKIDKAIHREFLLNFKKSMLLSLVGRSLLTKNQAERAFSILAAQSNRK